MARSGSTWLLRMLTHPLRLVDSSQDPEDLLGFVAPRTWQGTVDVIPVDTTFVANHLDAPRRSGRLQQGPGARHLQRGAGPASTRQLPLLLQIRGRMASRGASHDAGPLSPAGRANRRTLRDAVSAGGPEGGGRRPRGSAGDVDVPALEVRLPGPRRPRRGRLADRRQPARHLASGERVEDPRGAPRLRPPPGPRLDRRRGLDRAGVRGPSARAAEDGSLRGPARRPRREPRLPGRVARPPTGARGGWSGRSRPTPSTRSPPSRRARRSSSVPRPRGPGART